jgi:hypothetical protein
VKDAKDRVIAQRLVSESRASVGTVRQETNNSFPAITKELGLAFLLALNLVRPGAQNCGVGMFEKKGRD